MAKVTIEEEKEYKKAAKKDKLQKEEALDIGRPLGPLKKAAPEAFETLAYLERVTGKRKVEIMAEAINVYAEKLVSGQVWRRLFSVVKKYNIPLEALEELSDIFWDMYNFYEYKAHRREVQFSKEIIQGTIGEVLKWREEIWAEGYMAARQAYEERLRRMQQRGDESRRRRVEEMTEKIIARLEPLIEAMVEQMLAPTMRSMGVKRKSLEGVKVSVEGLD